MFLTDDHAERNKPRAGEKYRPANGYEGDLFASCYCRYCVHDKESPCTIQLRTLRHPADHPEYPQEWQYNTAGQPTCTAFELMGKADA